MTCRISRMGAKMGPWSSTAGLALAILLAPAVAGARPPSTHFQVLYRFSGKGGVYPRATLVLDAAGNLYGGTFFGGDLNCSSNPDIGCGTVFELSTSGREIVLHKFKGRDGWGPFLVGSLSLDAHGNLYGEAAFGGDSNTCGGCGTLFKLDSKGKETTLYTFTGGTDQAVPAGNLILDDGGNLYGTASDWFYSGYGAVFKVDPTGRETTLYTFQGVNNGDGSLPVGLVADRAGNFYGATQAGGIKCSDAQTGGCGTIFRLDTAGNETVLYSFKGATGDGATPWSTPMLDTNGNLYGTTTVGGASDNGTVFRFSTKTGKQKILHSFNGTDGYQPYSAVVFDAAGNLYGTTSGGGKFGYGTVYELTTMGSERVLHNFTGGRDGSEPIAGLTIDASGNLYGTAQAGGDPRCTAMQAGCGVVFKITP